LRTGSSQTSEARDDLRRNLAMIDRASEKAKVTLPLQSPDIVAANDHTKIQPGG
jgi:hypothetical protein